MKSVFCMFPGQGSQKVGMGQKAFETHDAARHLFERADKVLGFSLSKLCFEGPELELMKTAHTQPALLTVSTIYFTIASELLAGRYTPVIGAGHSLGEYSALVAAEAIGFDDAVMLVHKRGRYMQEAVPVGKGKMVAVLGQELSAIEQALAQVTAGVAQAANVNAPGQVVVAGDVAGVDQFVSLIPGIKAKELPVSAPFHCALMKPAEDALAKDLKTLSIKAPKFPVISNYFAEPLSDPERIREALKLQVCGRVRWVECCVAAIEQFKPDMAIEFGEGSTLTGLLKRINPDLPRSNASGIEEIEKLTT